MQIKKILEKGIHFLKKNIFNSYEFKKNNSISWFGNDYGGFYLDTSKLSSHDIVFSIGVGEDISFDKELIRYGLKKIYLFDPTPKSKRFIEQLNLNDNYTFLNIGVSNKDEKTKFYMPKNPTHVSGSIFVHSSTTDSDYIEVELKSIKTLLKNLNLDKIDILKMDIEGSEYAVLHRLIDDQIYPKQICVEFHNRYFQNGKYLFQKIKDKLLCNGYEVYGISKSGEEYLFVKV